MNILDIILLVPLAFGFIRGLQRGIIKELTGFASIIIGVLASFYYSEGLFSLMSGYFEPSIGLRTASFAIVFIVVAFVINQVGKALTKIINFMALGIINHLIGGAFGVLKFAAVIIVLIYFFEPFQKQRNFIQHETISNSLIYSNLSKYSEKVDYYLGDIADKSFELYDKVENKAEEAENQ